MSNKKERYSYGYEVFSDEKIEMPILTFGGGNIAVTDGWEDLSGFYGVMFSIVDEAKEIGEHPHPQAGDSHYSIPNIKMLMRFDKVESIDVVISKLKYCKEQLAKGETK